MKIFLGFRLFFLSILNNGLSRFDYEAAGYQPADLVKVSLIFLHPSNSGHEENSVFFSWFFRRRFFPQEILNFFLRSRCF